MPEDPLVVDSWTLAITLLLQVPAMHQTALFYLLQHFYGLKSLKCMARDMGIDSGLCSGFLFFCHRACLRKEFCVTMYRIGLSVGFCGLVIGVPIWSLWGFTTVIAGLHKISLRVDRRSSSASLYL